MKKLLVTAIVVAGLVGIAAPLQAFGCKRDCPPPAPPPCDVKYEERVVTCYRQVWKEKIVKDTITRRVPREVDEVRKCTILVPEMKEETRKCTTYKMVPKEVVREITCVKLGREEWIDPCTGCCKVTVKPHFYTNKVTEIICLPVPEDRTYTVQVCVYKPVERTYTCKRTVYDFVPQEVTRCVRYCEMEPYQVTIKVAICAPCCK